jgi:hypothetical protein
MSAHVPDVFSNPLIGTSGSVSHSDSLQVYRDLLEMLKREKHLGRTLTNRKPEP